MDVFSFCDQVVKDYGQFSRSFTQIKASDIKLFLDGKYKDGQFWPSPLIQLNPSFVSGGSIGDLITEQILHKECKSIFRWGKDNNKSGHELILHKHQREAIEIANKGESFIITSGTGSGKSLGYIIPIVNKVLKAREIGDQEKRIRAIVIYPMNALCNSQLEELQKYLGLGYPDGPKVTFARYTGQESPNERENIKNNPPDILLTNYVMLEYILTRQEPLDQKIINDSKGLDFLVLDELHTYRGRQGADVALLVRRIRQQLNNDLLCIGTSATMATEGTAKERNKIVAEVSSKLFGTKILPKNIITETLMRQTKGEIKSRKELIKALQNDYSSQQTAHWNSSDLENHPLAIWVELNLGLEKEDGIENGKWVRCKPKTLRKASLELAHLTNSSEELILSKLRCFLLAAYRVELAPNKRFFAFRLHQFISAGGDIYSTLQAENKRYLTLKGQKYKPKANRKSLLFPIVFCRSCGKEYHPVWAYLKNKRITSVEPRDFSDQSSKSERDVVNGYIMPDSKEEYDMDKIEAAKLPDGWLEGNKDNELIVKRNYRAFLPINLLLKPDGDASTKGIKYWFLNKSFRFCPNCGVEHNVRGSEFRKLCSLNSEGRSSATTTLSLSILRKLIASPDQEIQNNSKKLLAFSDNRQDASLQSGHFNDFLRVLQLRSALLAALRNTAEKELNIETLAQATEKALMLEANDFISTKDVKPPIEKSNRRALRLVLEYRLIVDLRKGWRITNPNLETLNLLEINYSELVNCVEDTNDWDKKHPLLARSSSVERFLICHRVLEELRERLSIDCEALTQEEFERRKRAAADLEETWSISSDEKPELTRTIITRPLQSKKRANGVEALSIKGAFGRWLKARERWLSVEDYYLTLKWDEDLYVEIIENIFSLMESWGLVKQSKVRFGNRESETLQGWQLAGTCLRWKLNDSSMKPIDKYSIALNEERIKNGRRGPTNNYFKNLYQDLSQKISEEGKPFLQNLKAREHTAQVDALERENREEAFRNASLRLLFCSPTMELGVDISSLNTVYLRNVPPTPANYAQRSGRAGRSGQPALVLSYCGATSPHDQYFFNEPVRMVAGAVTAPTIELANEELLKAHFRAIWLASTRKRLPAKVREIVDLSNDNRPINEDLLKALESESAYKASKSICQQIVEDLLENNWLGYSVPSWLTSSWLDALTKGAAIDFDQSLKRWRELLKAVDTQINQATKDLSNHALSERERMGADQRLKAARMQQQLLLADKSGNHNNDFSTYRYLASQCFMPGYNFPRLPLMAYLPGTREQVGGGKYLTRPRFVGISEFGPHSLIYHEGNTYKVKGALISLQENILPSSTAILATQDGLVCGSCGHMHLGTSIESELCCNCNTALEMHPNGNAVRIPSLYQIEQVTTTRADRITSDDEERQRLGYELLTTFEFPKENGEVSVAKAQISYNGSNFLELSYSPATTISRVNLGWRRRENKNDMGFPIHPVTGKWGGEKDLNINLDSKESEVGFTKITPYVQDRKNALLIRFTEEWENNILITLKNALKRGIEVTFQLDSSEIAAELMPNENEAKALLLYESAEGGAGVLSRFVENKNALQNVAINTLHLCHWTWNLEIPNLESELIDSDSECEAACYRCLLGYYNQRDHSLIDRRLLDLKQFLIHLSKSELIIQGGNNSRSDRFEKLLNLSGSGLEREWLRNVFSLGYFLPDDAQKELTNFYITPDFTYKETCAVIFIDGPHHEQPLQQRLDNKKRQALIDAGIRVIIFTKNKSSWPEIFKEYNWVFGDGRS